MTRTDGGSAPPEMGTDLVELVLAQSYAMHDAHAADREAVAQIRAELYARLDTHASEEASDIHTMLHMLHDKTAAMFRRHVHETRVMLARIRCAHRYLDG